MFVPHVIVRNLTGSPQSVTVTVEYPGEDGPAQAALPPLPLEAYTTKDIPLDLVLGSLPLPLPFCSIRIQYSGAPGSAIGEVSSIEEKGDLVIDSRLGNERDGWAGSGAHPWHLDDRTESVLFLTNMGDKDCPIGVHIQAEGSHYYLTDVSLKPHETRAIDLRKVRDEQKPDLKGNKVPAGATDGSVVWTRLDHVPVMGRLVVLQRHRSMASSYDCYICDCDPDFFDLDIDPAAIALLVYESILFEGEAWFREHCNQYQWPYYVDASWESLNPPVATIDGGGTATGQTGGTASIKAQFTDYYYTYDYVLIDCISHNRLRTAYATAKVITVSQSPSSFNMSTGDTKTITVAVTPSSVVVNTSFTGKSPPTSNPDSSCAVSLTIPGESGVSGSINHDVTASSAGCSGVFNSVRASATAETTTANSSNTTAVRVPPQVLIQMMEAEAGGTGNNTAMQSLGDVAQNRIHSSIFNPPYSNYQNTIVSGQFALSATTTGVLPELNLSVTVFTGGAGRFCNALGFWSATLTQWQTVQDAINSGTTAFPGGTGAPTYLAWSTQNQQILHVSAVGTKSDGRPNFLFLASRSSTQPAAVSASCSP